MEFRNTSDLISNTSTQETDHFPATNKLFEGTTTIVLYVCIGLVGIIGNSFAISILYRSTSMRKKIINILLINQSALDLCASVFLISIGYVDLKKTNRIVTFSGVLADMYCSIIWIRLPLWSMAFASGWNLVLINFERYAVLAA